MNSTNFFNDLHDIRCNQQYDGLPYSFHLNAVRKQFTKYQYLITNLPHEYLERFGNTFEISIAIDGHDSIEDGRLTYNDLKDRFSVRVAEMIYLCTEDKGRTRNDRKSDKWYEELKQNKCAVFVKLCDIMANSKYSLLMNSTMFEKYKSEYFAKVKPHLYCEEFSVMFEDLEKIFNC
jgi:hypothetical protein